MDVLPSCAPGVKGMGNWQQGSNCYRKCLFSLSELLETGLTWSSLILVTLSRLSFLSSLDSCSSSSGIAGDAEDANLRKANTCRILVWIFRIICVSGLGSLSGVEDPDDSSLGGAMAAAGDSTGRELARYACSRAFSQMNVVGKQS